LPVCQQFILMEFRPSLEQMPLPLRKRPGDGDCSQPRFSPWPRSFDSAAGARRRRPIPDCQPGAIGALTSTISDMQSNGPKESQDTSRHISTNPVTARRPAGLEEKCKCGGTADMCGRSIRAAGNYCARTCAVSAIGIVSKREDRPQRTSIRVVQLEARMATAGEIIGVSKTLRPSA